MVGKTRNEKLWHLLYNLKAEARLIDGDILASLVTNATVKMDLAASLAQVMVECFFIMGIFSRM